MLTPNQDEINDNLDLNFVMLKVNVADPVGVEICDLSGRVVANLSNMGVGSNYSYKWDAKESTGTLVPPGIYFLKINANLDAGDITKFHTISVAY